MLVRLAVAAILLAAAPARAFTIYGSDDRIEAKDAADARLRRLAKGVPALVENEDIAFDGATAKLDFSRYGKKLRLPKRSRFYGQPKAAFCSASLIAPDLALTAAHCVEDDDEAADCSSLSFVFDFAYDDSGRAPTQVPASSVYGCAGIVAIDHGQPEKGPEADWAVLRLAKPAADRPVLTISPSGTPAPGTPLVMIGYPSGLPEKIAFGTARAPGDDGMLRAEIDAFHGNSGSPVLDARTLEIVGVLVGGADDFKKVRTADVIEALTALLGGRPRDLVVIPRGQGNGESVMPASRIKAKLDEALKAPLFDGATR